MIDASFMQLLSQQYLGEDAVMSRIFEAASAGNVGLSFDMADLTADIIERLRDADYTVEPDTFHSGNVFVRWY